MNGRSDSAPRFLSATSTLHPRARMYRVFGISRLTVLYRRVKFQTDGPSTLATSMKSKSGIMKEVRKDM